MGRLVIGEFPSRDKLVGIFSRLLKNGGKAFFRG
jgi:hypothetical protein